MELYQLRTFVAVAEEGHLTRAAERLFISQPAVSAHIKALEEELGVALFTRSSRGMQLTRDGQTLRPQAEAALKSVGDLLSQARSLRENLTGELHLALNTDPELLRVRRLMDALRAAHPKLPRKAAVDDRERPRQMRPRDRQIGDRDRAVAALGQQDIAVRIERAEP